MSQGDIEKRTGLLRCYISRMENGHTVPAIDTLEKMAQALEVPVYRLFIDDAAVHKPNIPSQKNPSRAVNKEHARYLGALTKLFSRRRERNRVLLLHMASKMASSACQR
jgi:transcriptional regulator with XRE-family HTH domain